MRSLFQKKILVAITLILCFFVLSDISFAATSTQYQQLENIPGYEGNKTFPEYMQALYSLGLWIIGICALFMLSVGGFMYLTSAGNTASASTAKGVIRDALIGLVLALFTWLILYTINPELVDVNIGAVGLGEGTTGGAVQTVSPPSGNAQQLAQQVKDTYTLSSSGDCKDASGNTVSPASNMQEVIDGKSMTACHDGCAKDGSACTGQVNPSTSLLQAMITVADGKPKMTVNSFAGGDHSANSQHYKGTAVDISMNGIQNISQSIVDQFKSLGSPYAICDQNGTKVTCPSGNHVHADFR